MKKNRRDFIKKGSAMAALSVVGIGSAASGLLKSANGENSHSTKDSTFNKRNKKTDWPLKESKETPKLCMMCAPISEQKVIRRIKQLGINYVNSSGITAGWIESELRAEMEHAKSNGLTVINKMHLVSSNIILAREGRDADIAQFQESLRIAGKCGLPNVEYNFYVDRLIEGYYEMPGRGGATVTGYDYSKVKDLPAKPEIGVHKAEEIWANLTYFLKAVIPVAEKAGVRMSLHPNDPVAQVAHGSDQIMASLKGWKRFISIVDSPSNGITFDPGVECFIDEGQANLYAVMQEALKNGYKRGILPEHPHLLDYDREHPGTNLSGGMAGGGGGGGYAADVFNVAFARGLMWSVLSAK